MKIREGNLIVNMELGEVDLDMDSRKIHSINSIAIFIKIKVEFTMKLILLVLPV